MKHPLDFEEFEPCDMATWHSLVKKELGDKSYDSLLWKDENGIVIEPYLIRNENTILIPSNTRDNWQIAQTCVFEEDQKWNTSILDALQGGAQYITLDFQNHDNSILNIILKEVHLEFISIRFINHPNPEKLLIEFHKIIVERGLNINDITGSILGKFSSNLQIESFLEFAIKNLPNFHLVEVNAAELHNKGANAVIEIAFALSDGHQKLFELIETGLSVKEANKLILFNLGVGSSYFVEIAKFRVLRQLWDFILSKYDSQLAAEDKNFFVLAETSLRNQVEADIHNNILRATTQCMSAVLGGADAVNVHAYNAVTGNADQNSKRIARNIQHLLIEESYLDQAINAADGSYYLLELQKQLSDKAWELFTQMEAQGGIKNSSGLIENLLSEINTERELAIQKVKRVVVGLNKYQPSIHKA